MPMEDFIIMVYCLIESTFATVRHLTYKAKGCFSWTTILAMTFKLIQSPQKRWHRLRGFDQLANVIRGVQFRDGAWKQKS